VKGGGRSWKIQFRSAGSVVHLGKSHTALLLISKRHEPKVLLGLPKNGDHKGDGLQSLNALLSMPKAKY
jgi:hypothetical protein